MAKVNLWLPPIDSANWQRFIVPITLFRILNQISLKASIFPLNNSSFRNQYMPLCNIHTPKYMIDQIWLKVTSQDIQASVHKCTVHQNQSLQIFFFWRGFLKWYQVLQNNVALESFTFYKDRECISSPRALLFYYLLYICPLTWLFTSLMAGHIISGALPICPPVFLVSSWCCFSCSCWSFSTNSSTCIVRCF